MTRLHILSSLALALLLPACGGAEIERTVATLDEELVNGSDPLIATAIHEPIMSDPELRQRSNANAVRPPSEPYSSPMPADDVAPNIKVDEAGLMSAPAPSGACPDCAKARDALTLGALAAGQAGRIGAGCTAGLRYGADWANRLPAEIPLYPAARVREAAGNSAAKCSLRLVSFTTAASMQAVLDWYYTRATKAGYSAEHQADGGDHVLGGARKRDGAAFLLFLREGSSGGIIADIVVNRGA